MSVGMHALKHGLRDLHPGWRGLREQPAVVIEIGNDWLKILEVAGRGSSARIRKIYFKKLAAIQGAIADEIARVFQELKLSKQSVSVCIPRHLVTTRILEFPSTDPAEIRTMVNLQVSRQTPYSKEEIYYDFTLLKTKKDGYARVMLVIARRSLVVERTALLQKIGICPRWIALSSEGVAQGLLAGGNLPAAAVAVVDIDSNYADFLVLRENALVFSKNILTGANHLLDGGMQSVPAFTDELKRALELYREEFSGDQPVKILLSGAAKQMPDLAKTLMDRLNIPCEIHDPAASFCEEKILAYLAMAAHHPVSITPLWGVGLKGERLCFNIVSNEMRIQKLLDGRTRHLTAIGVLSSAIVVVLFLLVLLSNYNQKRYLAEIKQQITHIKKDADAVEKMRRLLYFIRAWLDPDGEPLLLLNELYRLTPREVYLTAIRIERKKGVVLQGKAPGMDAVVQYVSALEKSPSLKNVKNTHSSTQTEEGQPYFDFEIVSLYEELRRPS